MTAKTDRISHLLDDLDEDETLAVASEALDLLAINQIVELVLKLDPDTQREIVEHLSGED